MIISFRNEENLETSEGEFNINQKLYNTKYENLK